MRRQGDEIRLVAVLDQVVFRCARIVLFGTWIGTEEALVLTLRNFPPFVSLNASQGTGTGATSISAMEGRAHRRRAKAPFSHRSGIRDGPFPQARKATPAAHQGANLMEEAEPPKENVDPKRFSWLECEPLPLPQLREERSRSESRRCHRKRRSPMRVVGQRRK